MNTRKYGNPLVTREPFGVGGMTGADIEGYIFHPSRYIDGKNFKDGKSRFLRGQLYGKVFTIEEYENGTVNKVSVLYGYSQYYSRNSCRFVQSRAARKRGHKTNDRMYTDRAREYRGFCQRYHNGNPALVGKFAVVDESGNYFLTMRGKKVFWIADISGATVFTYKGEALFQVNVLHYKGIVARLARIVS